MSPVAPSLTTFCEPTRSAARSGRKRGTVTLGLELGVSGVKLTLAGHRRNGPYIIQRLRRRFPQELNFANASPDTIYDQLLNELPPPADSARLRVVAVLPPDLAIYSIQQAASQGEALRVAAAEMIGGVAEVFPLSADNFASYACPSQVSQVVVRAIEAAGYDCDEVISHTSTLRYAAHLAGQANAAILDWGWSGCVLSLPGGTSLDSHLTRSFTGCGFHTAVERATKLIGAPLQMADHMLQGRDSIKSTAINGRFSDALNSVIHPVLSVVAERIRQSFNYARRFHITPPAQLLLCGGGSLYPALANRLATLIGIPVKNWSMNSKLPERSESESVWAVSTAAALMPSDTDLW